MKSPLALLHFRGLFIALAVGSMLLALSAALYPLFLSSLESSLIRSQVSRPTVTPFGAGLFYSRSDVSFDEAGLRAPLLRDELGDEFQLLAAASPQLDPPIQYIWSDPVSVSTPDRATPPSGPISGRLLAATGALSHVEVLSGTEGAGVWLPDLIADAVDVESGDEIELHIGNRSVAVMVDGVYRSLYTQPQSGFWLRWYSEIYPDPACLFCPAPPQPILASLTQLLEAATELGRPEGTFAWSAPLRSDQTSTLDDAVKLQSFIGGLQTRMTDPDEYLGRLFECCGARYVDNDCCVIRTRTNLVSSMPTIVTLVQRRIAALEGPGRVLQWAGVLVAVLVIAAAGTVAQTARRVEGRLLFSRGAGVASVMLRSILESLLPCLIGALVGLGLGIAIVATIGPGGPVAGSRLFQAILSAVAGAGISIVLIGITSVSSYLRLSEKNRTRLGRLVSLPWEVGVSAAAIYAFTRIRSGGAFSTLDVVNGVAKPSIFVLLFPVLFIAGFGAIGARLLAAGLRRARDAGTRTLPSSYLALHRLAGAPGLTLILVAASTLSLGIFVQSQTMVRSLKATVDAKAKAYVGSDVQGRVNYSTPVPKGFPLPLTRVTRVLDAGQLPGLVRFDLLAIDPATFVASAYWLDGFSDQPIEEMVSRVAIASGADLPVIVVRGEGIQSGTPIELDQRRLGLDVVGHASGFPGMTSLRPLIVVSEGNLLRAFTGVGNPLDSAKASTEFWVRGDPAEAQSAFEGLQYAPHLVLTAEQVKDIPAIEAVIQTFLVLNALGLAAAVLLIVGILMYLQGRQRSQIVSYGLSLRMGMTHEGHRRALVLELGAMLLPSLFLAVGLALLATRMVVPLMDPLSTVPPAPLFEPPSLMIAGWFCCVLVVAWFGAWFTNRRARAFDFGQVMRLAD